LASEQSASNVVANLLTNLTLLLKVVRSAIPHHALLNECGLYTSSSEDFASQGNFQFDARKKFRRRMRIFQTIFERVEKAS
jgi:hypothetical protein